ncbi:APC family permease [Thermophilibacter immobilis]|jgi:hypothetical protein|uniref:APC family permease n=1 Tax=Thermophilibacter immobilis TaxID=2779519 RepID=A0A7S7RUH6_9ACTN|nr:APC family permease [Thermophilibacter immobilis]QOY60630.1 APC family permease [Thermophilibacter immobilis]
MSLRKTIDGARREAQENTVGLPKKEAEATKDDDEKKGFSRRSAANAKPAREAASSVRVSSKPKKGVVGAPAETKEQKRERKRKEREQDDLRNRAYDLVLRGIPGYKASEKIFFILMGVGFGLAVISLIAGYVLEGNDNYTTMQGVLSVASLVAAYVFIIGSFIYDLVKRRPYRREAEARVQGLTDKKIMDLFEKERSAQNAKRAQKEAAKAQGKGAKK